MTDKAVPTGIVAVVRAASPEEAVAIGSALAEGGVAHLEITFTVPDAPTAIRWLARNTAANVGAGTVMSPAQAAAAVAAGATFLVSPSLEPGVAEYASSVPVPAIPGALTPTEISRAIAAGASAVKLFPIGSVGGPNYVKAVAEVFPGVPWVVSGGITPQEVTAYEQAGSASICLGGALIDRDALARGDHAALVAHVRRVLDAAGSS
jgi:2-dehydro-3-deoxyphosphogluconate aldolase/(4S)-4-hydroxy-2-oxoglutarate aldolase